MNHVPVEVGKNTNTVMGGNKCVVLLCLMCTFLITELAAQGTLQEDSGVARMLRTYGELHKSKSTIKAWRIQIIASSDRRKVETEKNRFENIYPYLRLELVHDNPYYIIKLKDVAYREKIDALHLLHRIKRRYPAAILVLDDVKPQKLLTSEKY